MVDSVESITLKNFKGYLAKEDIPSGEFDLTVNGKAADLVLITGKNGVGKTSLLEAMNWALNQPDAGAGSYTTNSESSGSVTINEKEFKLAGNNVVDTQTLISVATFFFQENVDRLACDEIIDLLEPAYNLATEIKQQLRSFQKELENWQRQLNSYRYKKNYDNERKIFSAKVGQLASQLNIDSHLRKELEERTLTLKNGNLQAKWEAQIRNLSSSLSQLSNLAEPVNLSLPQQLNLVSQSLSKISQKDNDIQSSNKNSKTVSQQTQSLIASLPTSSKIQNSSLATAATSGESDRTLYLDTTFYRNRISKLETQQNQLRFEYQETSKLKEKLHGDEDSLSGWLNNFHSNINEWGGVWDGRDDKVDIEKILEELQHQLSSFTALMNLRTNEINTKINSTTEHSRTIASQLDQARIHLEIVSELIQLTSKSKLFKDKEKIPATDLLTFLQERTEHQTRDSKADSEMNQKKITDELGKVFSMWAELEACKIRDEANVSNSEEIEEAEKIVSDALAICKRESGTKSQLLSALNPVPQAQLYQLLQNMNQLLANFHFPSGFLPIEIEDNGTAKKPNWGFKTKTGVKFSDLSTGQKSQLAICWTINLNLALAEKIEHNAIGFDDFTTSLDMNQLIPASVLLRKMAYASDDDPSKRQVFVTSHHEDLTNRMLDFLLPPPGSSMKVIQFEDWSPDAGPQFKCYNVNMEDVGEEGLEDSLRRVIS